MIFKKGFCTKSCLFVFIENKATYEKKNDLEAFLEAEDIQANHPLDDFLEQKEVKVAFSRKK